MKNIKSRVLIVDDSALVRQLLTKILSSDPEIEVVGTAIDPEIAKKKILETKPDVITLDVEMPKMDGVTFLRLLMRNRPTPVVMISSLTERGAEITLDALEAGAVDFVNKPVLDVSGTLENFSEEIISKVKAAARIKVIKKDFSGRVQKNITKTLPTTEDNIDEKFSATVILQRTKKTFQKINTTDKVIAIGASTGGTEAIKDILVKLPADAPSIAIVQHIPPVFSAAFANRLDKLSAISVLEAKDDQLMLPGHAYIAPGDKHLLVVRDGAKYRCKLSVGPPVNRHRPSVDVLFRSVAQNAGANTLAILLTGMGADGAKGMLEIKETGGNTIAQDEKSSVVWGMPGEAVKIGAALKVLPLELIYNEITSSFKTK